MQQLKELGEPAPGIYRLLLEAAPGNGAPAPAWEAWLLFTDWEADLYTPARHERDPEAYAVLLRGKPAGHCRVTNLSLPHFQPKPGSWPRGNETYFALAASSSIDLPEGRYRFSATSDDGVRLYVDGRLAIDSWVLRNANRDDAVVNLAAGRHQLRVEYFQSNGGMQLRLQVAPAADLPLTGLPVRGFDAFERHRRKAESNRSEAALTAEIRQKPDSASALFRRAAFLAGERRFAESARDFAEGLKIDPSNPYDWSNSAVVALQAGDVEGYRRQCAEMLKRFGASSERNTCERVVRDCTVLSDAVPDLKPVMALADRAVAPDEGNGASFMQTWTALAKGMADYRAGDYESAARWLQKSIAGMDPSGQAIAYFFLAMAESKAGRGPGAESAFVKGNDLYKSDGPRGDTFPGQYKDWIIALHARDEAAKLLGHPLDAAGTPDQ